MEIARSIDTGEIFNKFQASEESLKKPSLFSGKSMFRCLDDDNCGIQLSLANYGSENGKLVYFYSSSKKKKHANDCRMEYGNIQEQEELISDINKNEGFKDLSENEKRTLLSQAATTTLIVKEPVKKKETVVVGGEQNREVRDLSIEKQIQKFSEYSSQKNKGFSNRPLTSLKSLYQQFLEDEQKNRTTTIGSIEWPSYDKNGKRRDRSFIHQLIKNEPFDLKGIFFDISKESASINMNEVKIFFGKAWVNKKNFVFIDDKEEHVNIWFSEEDITGFANAAVYRDALSKGYPIEIVVCGHFYNAATNKIKFIPRTTDPRNWLFVPNPEK
jgi:DNA-binding protein H-NS